MDFGYSRVSTVGQDLEVQRTFLLGEGIPEGRIFFDHGFSGKTADRDGLRTVLGVLGEGDKLTVPKLDRLARNVEETLRIVRELADRGVAFQFGKTVYDPADPFSKLFLTFLAAIAEAEGGWISLRTQEAMARPSVRAKLKGRRPSLTPKQDAAIARHLADGEFSAMEIAQMFGTSRASVYRAADRHQKRIERTQ
ncbi:recombinase family protein [Microbacterium amylolyticum]|uniref:DNA invertase Pin-like site-specific DNA recombinase n=1 Tax=Microbacterium amylolyticum TaxID=936337 RepID=A0ABS4ZLQ2_9MICO|nr:recombinase family protein [Microbacterium amylolyticum]MBP2436939.1 DNA invertase Pin-like site-specific DNA recombinase [Microbacterium amylolyticum]MBP2437880.1 DNA invertase Pin-like site-specific DNA recombinase [Microbacterium amylolyticum]